MDAVFDLGRRSRRVRRRVAGGTRARRQALARPAAVDLVRLVHYRGIDGKFRLFRYGTWVPAQWREFLSSTNSRAAWLAADELAYGAGMFSATGRMRRAGIPETRCSCVSIGQFHARSGRMCAPLDGWAASLMLVPPRVPERASRRSYGLAGLRRRTRRPRATRAVARRRSGL